MTGYIIFREDGAYVAPSGLPSSYTRYLQNARVFRTREQAEKEACGNETVASVDSQIRREG